MITIKKIQVVTFCNSDWETLESTISDKWTSLPYCGNDGNTIETVNYTIANAISEIQNGVSWRTYPFMYFQGSTLFAYAYVKTLEYCTQPYTMDEVIAAQTQYFQDFFKVTVQTKDTLLCSKKMQWKNQTTGSI